MKASIAKALPSDNQITAVANDQLNGLEPPNDKNVAEEQGTHIISESFLTFCKKLGHAFLSAYIKRIPSFHSDRQVQ